MSSRQWASSAATARSPGSEDGTRRPVASASTMRAERLTASKLVSKSGMSGIAVPRSDDLRAQSGQRAMLRHSDRAWRAADGLGRLLGAQANHDPQDQDFALLFRKHLQQR